MQMCKKCFELYNESEGLTNCPRLGCEGEVVSLDDEIGYEISLINRNLRYQNLPLRTIYSCSGHSFNGGDFDMYLGLGESDEYSFKSSYEFLNFIKPFKFNVIKPLYQSWYDNLKPIKGIELYDFKTALKECVKFDIFQTNKKSNLMIALEDEPKYRLFIYSPVKNICPEKDQKIMKIFYQLQMYFKMFLYDLCDISLENNQA